MRSRRVLAPVICALAFAFAGSHLVAHKGQASWRQMVAVPRDFEAEWISMAPAEKTKNVFYADDRVFWVVESGQMRVNIEGQAPFIASRGFLVQAAPRLAFSMETVGNEPVLLVAGTDGDVVQAPKAVFICASCAAG